MSVALQQGLGLLQQGRAREACDLFGGAVRADPANPLAHHLLGIAELQSGRVESGLASIRRAIGLNPLDAVAHGNLANGLRDAGRADEAMAAYARALELDPLFADAHLNRAALLAGLGRLREAEQDYRRALQLNPGNPLAHAAFGALLLNAGRPQEALAHYDQALMLFPDLPDGWKARGEALSRLGRFEEAAASFARAIGQSASDPQLFLAHGNALWQAGRNEEALQSYDRALQLAPDLAFAWGNRGAALRLLNRHEEALASLAKAIALDPQGAEHRFNRGVVLSDLQRNGEAMADFDAAMGLDPAFTPARLSGAFACLAAGEFERGWALYEARWGGPEGHPLAGQGPPLWLGETLLEGKTILLRAEQGLGDTLQFCRYVGRVKALGARVVLEAQAPLLPLLRTLDGVDLLSAQGAPPPAADVQCPLLSLPLALGPAEPPPATVPYLAAQPDKVTAWRERLGEPARPRVGLVWSGGLREEPAARWVNARRNLPFACLAALKGVEVQFVSLQKGEPAESELRAAKAGGWDGPDILDLTDGLGDFGDTAALVEALDLVISVDTSTAHLAGALGKPVWLLNRFDSCWRWLTGREDSPWYPSMRIYRQSAFDRWDEVIARVRADLAGWSPADAACAGGRH